MIRHLLNPKLAFYFGLLFLPLAPFPVWGLSIRADLEGFTVQEENLLNSALSLWENLILDPFSMNIEIHKQSMTNSTLGVSRNFLADSNGIPSSASIFINDLSSSTVGWFVDLTPETDEEFHSGKGPYHFLANQDGDAYGLYDLFTVVNHELAHAIGFTINYERFRENIALNSDGSRAYVGEDVTAILSPVYDGTHLESYYHPLDLMNPMLGRGERFHPSFLDLAIISDAFSFKNVNYPVIAPSPVCEPSSFGIMAIGFNLMLFSFRRRVINY